ncbi:hypothetical protein BV25DRAFT_717438 [Artomyces pyxidatus]|uniref:Uncharacterized protein n=1 Tax=Artomyces pyxidatus TaxID=48021 RepID=A0ACB8SZG4_9AGAM|nr:hypothetical protein BV25DRAFT_717438 [Artomyces pyxidatus]
MLAPLAMACRDRAKLHFFGPGIAPVDFSPFGVNLLLALSNSVGQWIQHADYLHGSFLRSAGVRNLAGDRPVDAPKSKHITHRPRASFRSVGITTALSPSRPVACSLTDDSHHVPRPASSSAAPRPSTSGGISAVVRLMIIHRAGCDVAKAYGPP